MQPTYEQLDLLVEVQEIDLAIMKNKKARAELPQRIQVMKVRKKREEIAPKLEQAIALQNSVEAQLTKVEDEDRGLAEKQERAQEIIDASGSDFRKVESHSKEMAGIAKRRVTLEEMSMELTGKLDKVKAVREQIENALATCDANEAKLRDSFKAQDDELVSQVRAHMARREELVAQLPEDLVKRYEATAQKTGGVALGKLNGDTCGVCRSVIEHGHLVALKSQAPLGTCPHCRRLLIVGDDESE